MSEYHERMVISYMDEAGHFRDPEGLYVGIAGFVAEEERWLSLENVWRQIMPIVGLTGPFHMKDFAHRKGEFAGWTEEKRRFVLQHLIEVVQVIKPIPIAAIVSVRDFRCLTETQQIGLKSPYHICFQACTHGAALHSDLTEENRVRMVYAENTEYGAVDPRPGAHDRQRGDVVRLWNAMKKITIYGPVMDSCTFGRPADMPGLQIADIFAYELRKEFEAQQLRPGVKMRWAMREILRLTENHPMIRLFNRDELLRLIVEARMPDQTGTEHVSDTDRQMLLAHAHRAEWIRARTSEFDALVQGSKD